MSQFNDSGYVSLTLTATVALYQRVTAAGAVAGLADSAFGYACQPGVSGDVIKVALPSKPGTVKAVASKSIAVNVPVYGVASGRVSDTQANTSFLQGISREAATAAGDVIEIVPIRGEVPKAP
jgi:acyl-coenzyme A thioesterase PaaI-like protein